LRVGPASTIEAHWRTLALFEFLRIKKVMRRLYVQIQRATAKRLLRCSGKGGRLTGGMRQGSPAPDRSFTQATTTRDLAELTTERFAHKEGERRHARYKLTVHSAPVFAHVSLSEHGG